MNKDAKKNATPQKSTTVKKLIMVVCLFVVLYEVITITIHHRENLQAKEAYSALQETYVSHPFSDTPEENVLSTPEAASADYPVLTVDYDGLKKINPDFIGWLYFPALGISYPVVQEQNINEYIVKTFEGEFNNNGAVFMDVASSSDFTGLSNFLFAHNMRNKTMFGRLPLLSKEENADLLTQNPFFYVYTKEAVFRYHTFAYYRTVANSVLYTEVGTDEEKYQQVLDYIKKANLYESAPSFDFTGNPELLHLSTCVESGTRRFVVSGIKDMTWE